MTNKSSFIKRSYEKIPRANISKIPGALRGFYTLMKKKRLNLFNGKFRQRYKIVYLGISDSHKRGILQRLESHDNSSRKSPHWNYFSVFEVKRRVNQKLLKELEALILHIYRNDLKVNKLNRIRGSNVVRSTRKDLK
jgi:hypothetical protein